MAFSQQTTPVEFQWDENKSASNEIKHGIDFELAKEVFDDPFHKSIALSKHEEHRWKVIGMIGGQSVIIVIHTYRTELGTHYCRIISARAASRKERNIYDDHNKNPT